MKIFAAAFAVSCLISCASQTEKREITRETKPDHAGEQKVFNGDAKPETTATGESLPPTLAGASDDEKTAALKAAAPVYAQLGEKKSRSPLMGSFVQGEALLKRSNPSKEADAVLEMQGFRLVYVCGFACLAPGTTTEQTELVESSGHATIPATGDVINKENKAYNERAQEFALIFNKRMIFKSHLNEAVVKSINDTELSVNGVTIGKSNLFNAIGRFGPNSIKHSTNVAGPTDYTCYVGDDGTLLTFESVADDGGGKDQVITGLKLMTGGELALKDVCKPSKKVSAALEVFGFKIHDHVPAKTSLFSLPLPRVSKKSNGPIISAILITVATESEEDSVSSVAITRQESRQ